MTLMLTMLPIDSVVAAEDNLRRRTGDVRDLAASITAVGIVEPLLVSPIAEGRYVIVAGHRRHAAAVKAGLGEVPCTVRQLSDAERVEIMLVENLQRSDLTPIEEASGYFRLVEHGMTQRELARRIGRSARHVAARLALLELPTVVQDELHSGAMTVADGQALLVFRSQPEVIERLLADEWSRREIERAVLRERHRQAAAKANAERRAAVEAQRAAEPDDTSDESGDPEPAIAAGTQEPAQRKQDPMAEERARAKARNQASKARIEFTRTLIERRVPKGDAIALIAVQVLADLSAAHARIACAMLGIEPIEGRFGPDHRGAIEAHAASGATARDRALLAAALAIGEESTKCNATSATAQRHVEFLATYGLDQPDTTAERR
ncbi:MAG: ParB/RepB/Spo0J family partition protein [Acidimicrobiia bacterium]